MSSKYRGLPDIDTAPDVFETFDEPESVLRPNDNGLGDDQVIVNPVSENIDSTSLPKHRKAQRVFGRGTKRPDPTFTFRPRLPPLQSHSYDNGDSSDEEKQIVVRETPAARLRRLKAELEEVEKEIQAQPPATGKLPTSTDGEKARISVVPPRQPIDLLSELSSLRTRIEGVHLAEVPSRPETTEEEHQWKDRLERLSQPVSGPGKEVTAKDGDGELKTGGLSEIDKRLAILEDLIGPTDVTYENTSSPLLTTLSKHDHLLSLLTQPRHLDAISRRVKLLLVDLDRAAAAARRQGGSQIASQHPSDKTVTLNNNEYASLQSLFTLLPRLDPLLPIIPPLLARLRSLAGLHTVAGDVANGLARLQENEKRGEEEVKELKDVVEGVQKGLDEAGRSILSNWEGVEKRMKEIEERVKKLDEYLGH